MEDAKIYVDYEYGKLQEVIVGLSTGMTPDLKAPWFENALRILPEDEAAYARETAGMNFADMVHPDTGKSESEMLEEETQAFITVLKKLGVKVLRPKEITPEFIRENYGKKILINGYSQDFPRDNLVIIGNTVIECNLRTPIRKTDISGFSEILRKKCVDGVRWVAMPHTEPLAIPGDETPLLEGGDVIVLGTTILVGNSMNPAVGSNEAGYRWLKNFLGDAFNVIRVPLVPEILHLDCVLSVPRRGLAILCPEAFAEGIPKVLEDFDTITVSLEDASRLAVNGLPVDESHYIMSFNDHNDNKFIREELEKRGISVYPVYFGVHNGQGGSLRCATQALMRRCEQ